MIKMFNDIYILSYSLWSFILPFGIYHGYIVGKNESKKNTYHYNSNLIIIPPNGLENYTIFTCCCVYSLIYFGISLIGGFGLYLFFNL
jgi:hypothetical protein